MFMREKNSTSPESLSKCTEIAPTLFTITSIEGNLYLSQRNYLSTYIRLEMNVESFLKTKTRQVIPTYTKGISFFTTHVCQVNVNILKNVFEQ